MDEKTQDHDESRALIDDLFTYHAPTGEQVSRLALLREAAKVFALEINRLCPCSTDRTAAMRLLQDAVMTANRSIVLNGRSYR